MLQCKTWYRRRSYVDTYAAKLKIELVSAIRAGYIVRIQ